MMQKQKTATLTTIFSDVLANLAFMFTDDDVQLGTPGDQWLETRISYMGPHKGTLVFRCSRSFAVLLAANLLGLDPEDEHAEDSAPDAAREFTHIVCGQLVTTLHGSDDIYNLTIPEVSELLETPDLSDSGGDEESVLSVEGHRIQLIYRPGA